MCGEHFSPEQVLRGLTKVHKTFYYSDCNMQKVLATFDKECPGLAKTYEAFLAKEQVGLVKKIKPLTDELGEIFKQVNLSHCKGCDRGKLGEENLGCCSECWSSHAHFRGDKDKIEYRKQLAELKQKFGWSEIYGFWTKEGCKLPREFRSMTCLEHICEEMEEALGKTKKARAREICKELREIRYVISGQMY